MNKDKIKLFLIFVIGLLTAFLGMYFYNNYKIEKKNQPEVPPSKVEYSQKEQNETSEENSIDHLTKDVVVINYVKANRKLPDYYITKADARNQGWIASKGNLCEVLPGRAIGGDKFSNHEKTLPSGNQYFEADVNYNCGNRNADRIIYTKNGDVWLTKNHYKTFEKQ
ncbi:MAG: ribonuclease N [Weeksellaceae bacterium]|nr:ribonuclease N [Bacteroidota bacterium]MCG2781520.1 ribonuclease N [Weeksellaceae bacterium]